MMKQESWRESKFRCTDGRLKASDDIRDQGAGSWLMVSIIADIYNDFIPAYAKGKLLDLGCGNVPMWGMYKHYISESVCVDWDNSEHPNPHIDIRTDISKQLPFNDDEFDTIICSDVLEHIYNPTEVLDEMVRICKKGGHILINTPFIYWMHEVPYDYNRYTPYFYQRYADESRVRLKELRIMGGTKEVIMDIIGKKLQGRVPYLVRGAQKLIYKRYRKANKECKGWTLGVAAVLEVL